MLSLVVPVYNRPQEVDELLVSLLQQKDGVDYEVILVEDGSTETCKKQYDHYKLLLPVQYFFKPNSGPGLSRNFGAEKAKGQYIIFLDSDVILPEGYLSAVARFLKNNPDVDAFGGPDRAHKSFTTIQKAINYSMTSFFTTGGIRGGKKRIGAFHPRSFNMGISQKVFQVTKGFSEMRFGEDIDMTLRILEAGFKTALIEDAYVYHKRRSTFKQFFKQIFNSGIARINLSLRHPGTLKLVHTLPVVFTLGCFGLILLTPFFVWAILPLILYALLIFVHASLSESSLKVGLKAIPASFMQLISYGLGFIIAFWRRIVLKRPEFAAYTRNFYK